MKALLVGHCLPDRMFLSRAVKRALQEVETEAVNSDNALEKHFEDADLLLVNRVLDGRFQAAGGVDLIRSLSERRGDGRPAMMLISDYPEAQREAEQAGAAPGVGKSQLRDDEAARRFREAAGVPDNA